MKWNLERIYFVTLFAQMAALFLSWWWKLLVSDGSYFGVVAVVAVIGSVGGVLMRWQKQRNGKERLTEFTVVQLLTSLLVTVGTYFVFVPMLSIFAHGGVVAFLLIVGIVAPFFLIILPSPSRRTDYPPG